MNFNSTLQILMLLCVGIGLFSLTAPTATAQTARPALTIQIQSFPGVERVVVSTASGKPVASDLELQVVAQAASYRNVGVLVSRELVITAGNSTGIAELPVLMRQDQWLSVQIHVEQDNNGVFSSRDLMRTDSSPAFGRHYPINHQLFVTSNLSSIPDRTFLCANARQTNSGGQGLGVADPAKLPSFKELATFYESQNVINPGTVTSDLSFLQNANHVFKSIHPNDFFECWTSLTLFKSILISNSDLRSLAKANAKLEALRNWVIAGGQLVVVDCGEVFGNREEVMRQVLGKPDTLSSKWQEPGSSLKGLDNFSTTQSWYSGQANIGIAVPGGNVDHYLPKFSPATEFADQAFIKTDLMNGSVFVIDDDLTDWREKDWQLLHNAVFFSGGGVEKTLGANSCAGSYQPDFRIPGVGDPPVLAFQILIGMFVLLIGPGFYFFFRATGRLYLLLVSTPLFSLAAVLMLFGYGILSDGFEMQGRVISVTEIDHSMDSAFTHARHVFYSGLAPRDCRYNDQTIALGSHDLYSPTTRFRYRDRQLSISGGQIKARSPFQMTSLSCFETDQRLTFSKSSSGDPSGIVTNSFANRVKLAAVRTNDGWFLAENIDADSSGAARKVEFGAIRDSVSSLVYKSFSAVPLRLESRNPNQVFVDNSVRYLDINDGSWGHSDDLISQWSGSRINESLIPVNSYLAILENNDLVVNPQPTAIYRENQLHVIVGKW